jgi:hypothetical protein
MRRGRTARHETLGNAAVFFFTVAVPAEFTYPFTLSLTTKHQNKTNITHRTIWLLSYRAQTICEMFFYEDEIVKESAGPKFAMYFTVTPVAERTSIAWTYVAN